jgi:acetyl-CoA carboxylase biotin carboxyl carrier protein
MAARGQAARDHRTLTELARQLGALLNELDLSEIEAGVGDLKLRLQRQRPAPAVVAPVPAVGTPAVPAPASVVEVSSTGAALVTIEAPMVGTFYRASSPSADPYVREGDVVKEGQILCIIEAMKLMNEIESKASGRIAKILVENGQPVEYGQPLFLIEPTG